MGKLDIFSAVNTLLEQVEMLNSRLEKLEKSNDHAFEVLHSQLMRVKNGQKLPDDYVLKRRQYLDLAPYKAYEIYQDPDQDFLLLDVSGEEFENENDLPEALKIPLEELGARLDEVPSKKTSLLVISEDGTKSILACELLNGQGYFNVSNISGGHRYWPAHKMQSVV